MKIVYLLDWFLYYTTELANAVAEEHEVLLIPRDHNFEVSSADDPMSLDEYLGAALGPRVTTERLRYRRGDPRSLAEVVRLAAKIRAWGADVIHVQDTTDWRIALLAHLCGPTPVVVTVHDVSSHPGESRGLLSAPRGRLLRRARAVIVHGQHLREQLARALPHTRIVVIPHGTLSLYRHWDDPRVRDDGRTVLFFGRITAYKGLGTLAEAAALVGAAVPGVKFVVAGRGPELARHRAAMEAAGVFEIHDAFVPNREVSRFFRRATVVVLPYTEASQSGVIPVAYAFAKPVVATRVGSLPEAVEEGESGFIVPPGEPAALASAITRILTDGSLRARMEAGAARMADTVLSWKSIAGTTAALYAELAR